MLLLIFTPLSLFSMGILLKIGWALQTLLKLLIYCQNASQKDWERHSQGNRWGKPTPYTTVNNILKGKIVFDLTGEKMASCYCILRYNTKNTIYNNNFVFFSILVSLIFSKFFWSFEFICELSNQVLLHFSIRIQWFPIEISKSTLHNAHIFLNG